MPAYGILGGAFDPIHNGHIRLLSQVHKKLPFTQLFFMPYGISPTSKRNYATSSQRQDMIVAVLKQHPHFGIERCELEDRQPSWTAATISRLRSRYGKDIHLSFIMGMDSYASLQTWQDWEDLAEMVHFIVINRRGTQLNDSLRKWEAPRLVQQEEFFDYPAGKVLHLRIPFTDISSTLVRQKIHQGRELDDMLPPSVHQYIEENNLYQ